MSEADAYTVLTPFGVVMATFPDDAGVVLDGPADAVAAVRREIVVAVGPIGITLDPETLAEEDFEAFCQGPGRAIRILPPLRMPTPEPGGDALALAGAQRRLAVLKQLREMLE